MRSVMVRYMRRCPMRCNESFGASDSRLAFRDLRPSQPTKLDAILFRHRHVTGLG